MIDKIGVPMQMPNASEDIWIPQKPTRESYHHPVPPDVVPQYQSKIDWNTIPRGISGKKKSLKRTPHYENVVIKGVKPKDYIELTKTVKNSLILAENDESEPVEEAYRPPERTPIQTTYRMPPLTPTVANLIHTSSVLNNSYSKVGSGSKVMKPVSTDPPIAETSHLVTDGPEDYKNKSYPAREYRNGTRLLNRGCILREDRNASGGQSSQSRYSWTSAPDEFATSHRKPSASYSTNTMPSQFERKMSSSSTGKPSMAPPPTPGQAKHVASSTSKGSPSRAIRSPSRSTNYAAMTQSLHRHHSKISEESTSFSKTPSRRPSNVPPPPPRRSPNTKLTKPKEGGRIAPGNSMTLPLKGRHANSIDVSIPEGVGSPEGELPVLPPPLPLYNPPARPKPDLQTQSNPNSINLPVPPPPPPKQIPGSSPENHFPAKIGGHPDEDPDYDFPPPPLL